MDAKDKYITDVVNAIWKNIQIDIRTSETMLLMKVEMSTIGG